MTRLNRRVLLLAATGLLAALLLTVVSARADAAPRSFFGIQAWNAPSAKSYKRIGRAKIGTFRAQVGWDAVEPTRGQRNWTKSDALFTGASKAHLTVLPYLLGSPKFAASRPQYPPMSDSARQRWIDFVNDFVARYGHDGTFWAAHPGLPKLPPKAVQVWNEPNFRGYWNGHPNAAEYEKFVSQTATAARGRDPKLRIALAGFPQTKLGIIGTRFLRQYYAIQGSRDSFDIVAVHPYAHDYRGVLGSIKRARKTMHANGDSKKAVWITEIGWASAGLVSRNTRKFKTTRRGQAIRLKKTYKATLKYRRRYHIGLVAWFALKDRSPLKGERNYWAINTGLFTRGGKAKPAWRTYRRITRRASR